MAKKHRSIGRKICYVGHSHQTSRYISIIRSFLHGNLFCKDLKLKVNIRTIGERWLKSTASQFRCRFAVTCIALLVKIYHLSCSMTSIWWILRCLPNILIEMPILWYRIIWSFQSLLERNTPVVWFTRLIQVSRSRLLTLPRNLNIPIHLTRA